MYVNGKMIPVETVPGIMEGVNLSMMHLIHCKNLCGCHNLSHQHNNKNIKNKKDIGLLNHLFSFFPVFIEEVNFQNFATLLCNLEKKSVPDLI
jgi:hypothetical protein